MGRSCGDEHILACPGQGRCEVCCNLVCDFFRFSHSAFAMQPACEWARSRLDDANATVRQRLKVGLGGFMREHVEVHGRRNGNRASCAQQHGLQEVVATTVHHGCQGVGSCWGHKDQISPNPEFHVVGPDSSVFVFSEVRMNGVVHQGGQRQRGDEFGGAGGHDHAHFRTPAPQFTRKHGRLVGGDAPGDAENNASTR